MKPFNGEEKVIYEDCGFKMVIGKATTNKDEEFCIGLRSGNFPRNAYLVFPPQLNLDLLQILLGKKGAKDEQIREAIKQIEQKENKGE